MTDLHTCSYSCDRLACIKAQRRQLHAENERLHGEVDSMKAEQRLAEQKLDQHSIINEAQHLRLMAVIEERDALREAARQALELIAPAEAEPGGPEYAAHVDKARDTLRKALDE